MPDLNGEQYMQTIDEIISALDQGKIAPSANVIKQGALISHNGTQCPFELHYGWDIVRSRACDREWGSYNIALMQYIKAQNYDDATLAKVLGDIQIDDSHWRWFNKAIFHRADGYHWFFLVADNHQQGACLVYQPKKAAVEDVDLFYIEYLAAAPWNRGNPMEEKRYQKVGTLIIKSIVEYISTNLKLGHAFSLHALPRASGFYKKIGMKAYPDHDKDSLQYFEMAESDAVTYMRAP